MTSTNPPSSSALAHAFCWVDLCSPDPQAACAFYAALCGFTYQDLDNEAGVYHLIQPRTGHAGGIMGLMQPGQPGGWTPYIHVADLEAKLAEAQAQGATPVMPRTEIPGGGWIAWVRDPQGNSLGLYQAAPDGPPPPQTDPEAGPHFSFHELRAADPQAAAAFYTGLFGWQLQAMECGGQPYQLIDPGQGCQGGIGPGDPRGWLPFLRVPVLADSIAQAEDLGGRVEIPVTGMDEGSFAVLRDPQGVAFGLAEISSEAR